MIDTNTDTVKSLMDGVTEGSWKTGQSSWNDEGEVQYTLHGIKHAGYADCMFIAAARDLVPALLAERDGLRAQLDYANKRIEHAFERNDRQAQTIDELTARIRSALTVTPHVPAKVQALVEDSRLLLDAYKAVLVLHRVMDKHGLTAGASAAENIADRIVAAHPEFPGLCAFRDAALAAMKEV